MSAKNYKNEFTKILGNLEIVSKNNGDIFRARAYKKAQEQVMVSMEYCHLFPTLKTYHILVKQ